MCRWIKYQILDPFHIKDSPKNHKVYKPMLFQQIQIKLNNGTPAKMLNNFGTQYTQAWHFRKKKSRIKMEHDFSFCCAGKSEQWKENCASLRHSNLSNGHKMAAADASQHGCFRGLLIKNASYLTVRTRSARTCGPLFAYFHLPFVGIKGVLLEDHYTFLSHECAFFPIR